MQGIMGPVSQMVALEPVQLVSRQCLGSSYSCIYTMDFRALAQYLDLFVFTGLGEPLLTL